MKFSNFDYSRFDNEIPIVKVTFGDKIESDEEINNFFKEWLSLYLKKKHFIFLFETKNLGMFAFPYIRQGANILKQIKSLKKNYLKFTILIIRGTIIRNLINMLFTIQKPSQIVYIVKDEIEAEDLYIKKCNNENCDDYTCVYP
tara:strand:+ start:759 stop:1190 length:432 start_codon:yes stop_codon:yes gene_type:complete